MQPEFSLHEDDHYHVGDLLPYHDAAFVWNGYRALLKREPDEEGFQAYLELLRSGRRNKIDILASLQRSQEGKRAQVSVDGLTGPALIRRLIAADYLQLSLQLLWPVLSWCAAKDNREPFSCPSRCLRHCTYTNALADQI